MSKYLRILLFGVCGFGIIIVLFELPYVIPILISIACILLIGSLMNMLYENKVIKEK